MDDILFWLYLTNTLTLTVHEIDSAYWKEWKLFHLPVREAGFLLLHFPLLFPVLFGLVLVDRGEFVGLILSLFLCGGGLFAFSIHTSFIRRGYVDFLPPLGLAALPMWFLTFGIGEETGWRGFALPRLQEGHSALHATIILWVFWALWHLPLFFYSYETSILPGFLIGLLAGAIVFTWLYNSTGGSILMVALWHGAFNFTTACVTCKTSVNAAVISTLVMVWAVVVVWRFKPTRLSHAAEQVI